MPVGRVVRLKLLIATSRFWNFINWDPPIFYFFTCLLSRIMKWIVDFDTAKGVCVGIFWQFHPRAELLYRQSCHTYKSKKKWKKRGQVYFENKFEMVLFLIKSEVTFLDIPIKIWYILKYVKKAAKWRKGKAKIRVWGGTTKRGGNITLEETLRYIWI